MTKSINISKTYQVLSHIGLNEKDAKIYLELLKHGPTGISVNELDHYLGDIIPRTTIYSILNKLKQLGCVKEEGISNKGGRKATKYVPIRFSEFISLLINSKEKEINKLKVLNKEYSDYFNYIFQSGMEYTIEDLNEEFKPYIKPLLEKGWKIISFDTKVWEEYFEYKVYDCMLMIPYAKYLKDQNSIHLFEFKYEIEHEKKSLGSMIDSLKRRTEDVIGYETDLSEFKLLDTKYTYLNRTNPGLVLKVKIKDLKKSRYFSEFDISDILPENVNETYEIEIWKAVIIPYKHKVFFVWAESLELIGEMIEAIDKVENISKDPPKQNE